MWTVILCSLSFFMFDETRKRRPKVFSPVERLICFSQLCVLNNLLGPRKRSFIFQSNCQNSLRTVIKCSLMFVTLDDTRKKGQKLFSSLKQFFFEMFVSIDLLGSKEVIFPFRQKMSKYLVDIYKKFHDLFMFCKTRKNRSKSFLQWKGCLFFFQNFMFSTTS